VLVDREVQFEEAGISHHRRRKVPACFESSAAWRTPVPGRWPRNRPESPAPAPACKTTTELPLRKRTTLGDMEDVLIEAGKEKRTVAPDRAAQGKAELLLLIVRLEIHEGMRSRQRAVAQEIEIRSVQPGLKLRWRITDQK
jgi:hypothetical protein